MIKPVTLPDPLFFMLVLSRGSSSWDEMGLYCDNVKLELESRTRTQSPTLSPVLSFLIFILRQQNKALYQNVFSFRASGLL